jgi:hypothetical protein
VAIETQTLRPSAGQQKVLKFLARGARIEEVFMSQPGEYGVEKRIRYLMHDEAASPVSKHSVDSCLARGWVEVQEVTKLLRLTPAGESAMRHFERTGYKIYNRG